MQATDQTTEVDPEILLWPHLSRFYGLSMNDLLGMPRKVVQIYLEAMPEIQAQEQLLAIQASDAPHMEQAARESLHRRLSRMAEASIPDEPVRDPRKADVVRDLAAMGIKVVEG